jgi:ParB-like chromosome segregation protein Spo0J
MSELDIFSIPVHPVADKFLMLDEEELEELAADIKANGLQHPLVIAEVEGKLLLVDGRNRREACLRVGKERYGALPTRVGAARFNSKSSKCPLANNVLKREM